MKRYLAIAGLVSVTVIWGGGFVASDMALESLTPFQIMTVRFLIASVCMWLVGFHELQGVGKKEIKSGFWMGCALFAAFSLQIIGLQYTTPSKNAFLTATNVVMVPFITLLVCKKRVAKNGIIGAVMAVVGVGVLSLSRDVGFGIGDLLSLLCAVGFAFQIFLTGEFVKACSASVLNFVQMCTAFLLSLFFLICSGQIEFHATGKGWLAVLYLGLISTTVSYFLQTICQKYVDETKAAIILSLESVFGTIFSILILGEQITVKMFAGCILILVAVIISNLSVEKAAEK